MGKLQGDSKFNLSGEAGLTFILPLIAMLTKGPEMPQPDTFCGHTIQQNATTAGATALPQIP